MKKGIALILTLVLLASFGLVASAEFYPMGTPVFTTANSFEITEANEENGRISVQEGAGFEATYLQDNASVQGLEIKALSGSNGDAAGLVTSEGFRFPVVSDAKQDYTYYYEFTINMSNLGTSNFRAYVKSKENKDCLEVQISKDAVYLKNVDKLYTIPESEQNQDVTIGIAYRAPYNYSTTMCAFYVNDVEVSGFVECRDLNSEKFGTRPDGYMQFYFFNCAQGDSFIIKNYKVYESISNAHTPDYLPAETSEHLIKKIDINFSENSIANGDIILPTGNGTQFTALNKKETVPGISLVSTADGVQGGVTINGVTNGTYNEFYWGVGYQYLCYWEITANISGIADEDAYRFNIMRSNNRANGASGNKSLLATLSIGKERLILGYEDVLTEGFQSYAGSATIPEEYQSGDVKIGVAYNPVTGKIAAYINGKAVISYANARFSGAYTSSTAGPHGGPYEIVSTENVKEGNELVVKSFVAGYIKDSSIPTDGKVNVTLNVSEGPIATATAILSKDGDSAHYTDAVLYVAVYGENGALKNVSRASEIVKGGERGVEISTSVSGYETGDSVRAFVWESKTLKPLY